jgi:pimeloyl-ACP methyl ester carboxylesterase
MTPTTTITGRSATGPTPYTTSSVRSKDGTTIGYRQLGQGPGLIMLHGAMESAQSHMQLAEALADAFTIYLPDRRGRGMSGPFGDTFCSQKNLEDMEALLSITGAQYLFGVSSGAIISLQATLALPAIQKTAIFEPPLPINGSISTAFLARYDEELAQGKVADALVTGMLGAQMGPPIFQSMPRWLLRLLTEMMMASEDKRAKHGDVTMSKLAPTLHYDFQLGSEMEGALDQFRDISTPLLLLGGSASPAYFKTAIDALAMLLPHARRVELPGLGHGASGNRDRGGQPKRVAEELRRFFES